MLKNWFDPQRQGDIDKSDLLEEEQRQGSEADALLVGRRTFEAFREYWPKQSDDGTVHHRVPQPRTEVRRVLDDHGPAVGELDGAFR